MRTVPNSLIISAFALSFLSLFYCCADNSTGLGDSDPVIVTGIVVAIEDMVPVDGGVTIDLRCLHGRSERLLFPSLFTNPPPSEDILELYQVILLVERGDLVRASGTRTEDGIALEDLTILRK